MILKILKSMYDGCTTTFNVIGLDGAFVKGGPRYGGDGGGDLYGCSCGY